MEATRSRSQSPIAKCKTKIEVKTSDCGENGDDNNDQIKTRKRNQKIKQKVQATEKDLEKNGNGIAKKDIMEFSTQLVDINNKEQCNEVTNGNGTENSSNVSCPDDEENVENNNFNNEQDKGQCGIILEPQNDVELLSVTENNKNGDLKVKDQENLICTSLNEDQYRMPNVDTRTEEEPKNKIENEPENLEDKRNSDNLPEVNNVSLTCTNGDTTNGSSFQDGTEANDSHENSIYEDASISDENLIQTSFDAATKKDTSFTDKLSNFIGKWNTISPAQSPRQVDSEVSSSKKYNSPVASDSKIILHPYLSKISGRPGIKEKLNSGYITNGKDVDTPKNLKLTLDDSFRVKSDPPRLNQEDPQENSVLRKYKGKRCLNTYDESEDGEDISIVNSKRRKLDENLSKPGFLGSILLSPFKKRPLSVDEPSKLSASQSKISRFLSPFWFWKKTATVEQDPK